MGMNRRGFLGRLAAAAAAAVAATDTEMLDPEKLLWTPGKKTIFLPSTTILKAEDVAVAEIRDKFKAKSLIEPGQRILHPSEFEPRVASRDRDYYGARYTLTTRSPDGGLLQQKFDTNWKKVGEVTHRGRGGFEPLARNASAVEVAAFNRNANADIRTGRVGEHDDNEDAAAFMRRFKERG